MDSCIGEASEFCLQGCLPIPSLGLQNPKSLVSTDSVAVSRLNFEVAMASSITPSPCSYFTNHESLLSLQESFCNFTTTFPHYTSTDQADRIREKEYYHLADTNHVCLDYIGHGLFSYSQLQCSSQVASSSSTANTPFDICCKSVDLHSQVQSRSTQSKLEGDISKRIMSFMNISTDDYTMVFTANQSSAFKLLADSYPFQSNPRLLTAYDHENEAAKIMIENSKKRGSRIMSAEFMWPTLRIMSEKLRKKLTSKKKKKSNKGLFVFPLQSRITGTRYSYLWMQMAQENGWHVLLDACAFGPKEMETLGLSLFKPDFLICSFFKVFGDNPSGFGCLFVKKSAATVLQGTSSSASSVGLISLVPSNQHLERSASTDMEQEHEAKPESLHGIIGTEHGSSSSGLISCQQKHQNTDGESKETESSPSGNSLEFRGLDHADALGLILISAKARYLTNWLVNALLSLRHPHPDKGHHLVRIYGPKVSFQRSPAVAFNLFDWKRDKIDPALVQKLAGRRNITLSCGLLSHVRFVDKDKEVAVLGERTIGNDRGGESVGSSEKTEKNQRGISVVTAALGFLTNFEDMYRLWAFVSRFLDADFVEKENWRYSALNQQTVEV